MSYFPADDMTNTVVSKIQRVSYVIHSTNPSNLWMNWMNIVCIMYVLGRNKLNLQPTSVIYLMCVPLYMSKDVFYFLYKVQNNFSFFLSFTHPLKLTLYLSFGGSLNHLDNQNTPCNLFSEWTTYTFSFSFFSFYNIPKIVTCQFFLLHSNKLSFIFAGVD